MIRPCSHLLKGSASPIKVTEFLARSFRAPFGDFAMNEVWKEIKGFEGYYDVSNIGRIKSVRNKNLILSPRWADGYHQAGLSKNNQRYYRLVHRLVLEAFVGQCPEGMECCHNDGVRSNNNINNLRWDTRKGNFSDKKNHGTEYCGAKNHKTKLKESEVLEIRRLAKDGRTCIDLAKVYGVTFSNIYYIIKRKTWKHLPEQNKEK